MFSIFSKTIEMELDENKFNDLAQDYIKKWILLGDEPLTLNNFDLINRVGFIESGSEATDPPKREGEKECRKWNI